MATIISGLVIALIGGLNLVTGRMHPDRINARLQRGMGYVGLAVGLLVALGGVFMLMVPNPPPQ